MLQRLTHLTLASASPRRQQLLLQLQPALQLMIQPAEIDESLIEGEAASIRVLRLAQAKAEASWQRLTPDQQAWPLLAADTEVVLDGQALSKPANPEEATSFLTRLAGREHQVQTSVVLKTAQQTSHCLVTTQVKMRALDPAEIEAYIATQEYQDKAGGYAIQGQAAAFIEQIQGSYTNVVGLPLEAVYQLLTHHGYTVI